MTVAGPEAENTVVAGASRAAPAAPAGKCVRLIGLERVYSADVAGEFNTPSQFYGVACVAQYARYCCRMRWWCAPE